VCSKAFTLLSLPCGIVVAAGLYPHQVEDPSSGLNLLILWPHPAFGVWEVRRTMLKTHRVVLVLELLSRFADAFRFIILHGSHTHPPLQVGLRVRFEFSFNRSEGHLSLTLSIVRVVARTLYALLLDRISNIIGLYTALGILPKELLNI
jgi:hypothetical protein